MMDNLAFLAPLCIALCFCSCMSLYDKFKEKKRDVYICKYDTECKDKTSYFCKNISCEEELKHMNNLKNLIEHVKSLNLPKFAEEDILRIVDLRLYMIEKDVTDKLGKKALNEMKKV